MNAATALIQEAAADGVVLSVAPSGTVKAKGPTEAVARWLPTIRERKSEIVSALTTATPAPSRRWHVYFNDGRPPMEVIFSDDQTVAEAQALYPGAVQPVPEIAARSATVAEEAELHRLIGLVLAGDTAEDRSEALTVAMHDVDSALTCYRALAADVQTSSTKDETS